MQQTWKEQIYLQREQLAYRLRAPLGQLGERCTRAWGNKDRLNEILLDGLASVPFCNLLYMLGTDGVQVSDNIGQEGIVPGHYGRDRSQRPYMKETVPAWGFLLSDAYVSLLTHRPGLTALQVVRSDQGMLGYVGADFDLRDLPVTAELYEEPGDWRQIKGDPAIRSTLFQQSRVESPMDRNLDKALPIVEELLTERGIFQCQINFSSSQANIWTVDDPFRYRILDFDDLADPGICLVYPRHPYPQEAVIPLPRIREVLNRFRELRFIDENIYLRSGSLNIFNGIVGLNFSCDGSHYMPWSEFLSLSMDFWIGSGEICAVDDAVAPEAPDARTATADAVKSKRDA